jgi:hypothetical protein
VQWCASQPSCVAVVVVVMVQHRLGVARALCAKAGSLQVMVPHPCDRLTAEGDAASLPAEAESPEGSATLLACAPCDSSHVRVSVCRRRCRCAAVYAQFQAVLIALLDASIDASKFEDECRRLLGTGAYLLFTLDKVIAQVVRQLNVMVADPLTTKLRVCAPELLDRATVGDGRDLRVRVLRRHSTGVICTAACFSSALCPRNSVRRSSQPKTRRTRRCAAASCPRAAKTATLYGTGR